MTSRVKVIFFDAGGTLFRPYPSVGEVYARIAAKHGVHVDAAHVEKAFHDQWHLRNGMTSLSGQTRKQAGSDPLSKKGLTPLESSEKIERDWWYRMVTDVFSGKGSDPTAATKGGQTPFRDFDAFFEELYDLFARAECWRLFDDAVPVLKKLKEKGYRLGIISNWDHRLFSIVDQLGLSGYFEAVVASAAVGATKPGRRIFEEALKAMRAQLSESLHIGDSLEDDYRGASRAGLKALLLSRHSPRSLAGYNGVVSIKTLHELPTLLS